MKILMLTDSNFPADVRIRQEAFKLIEFGHSVSVIAIKDKVQSYFETVKGVNVYRIPKIELFKKGKQAKLENIDLFQKLGIFFRAILGYGFEYLYFTTASFLISLFLMLRDRFDVVHTHNPPDTLFIVALFYKMFGRKFVYDHHDLCPDLFLEKYGSGNVFIYKILRLLEKVSCQMADVIIATNESYKKIEIKRCGVNPENIYVVRNGPDLNEMKISEPIKHIKTNSKTILCYLGEINIQDGVDNLLHMFSKIVFQHRYNDLILMIVGDGDYLYRIKEMTKTLNLNSYVFFTGHISDRGELNRYLSSADIFVDAAPYSFLNDNSTFTKHMEYMVYEKPIVSFALKESMFSLNGAGVFVEDDDIDEMAKTILDLIQDEKKRYELGLKARERVKSLSWVKVSLPLINAYEDILGDQIRKGQLF